MPGPRRRARGDQPETETRGIGTIGGDTAPGRDATEVELDRLAIPGHDARDGAVDDLFE